ncbi:myb-like protein Q [Carex littledalei]|uniref:Myb-like protein Q n=1 Tax=Carex littledalei TaxID=544730 RepID=A0A833QHQ5_9POAL|nr:myb-like protein Q [Carex littledalei]
MEGSDVALVSSSDAPGKKDRHVVTWTTQEDDLLREQIALLGTNNWTSISSKFKDKTSRQCRRRWYTYLNSECKKGGWSAEEDMLLCEAQKILGNRWTEIAKVVAGRTDNAVKNRFSTLCKKRAKDETLYKENNVPCVNTDSDRYLFTRDRLISAGIDMSSLPAKKMRYDHSDSSERMKATNRFLIPEITEKEQLRQPLLEVSQNAGYSKEPSINVSGAVAKGTFLQKDESKLTALLQQAELLSSLAIRVNTESTKESLDEAWKQLQDYMNQMEKVAVKKEKSDANSILDNLKDLIENLRNGKEPNLQMGLQLQEQSTKASNSKSLLDTQIHASGIMVDTLFDDLISIPYEEDPISTNEEVGPGASIRLSEKMERENGSSSAKKDLADSNFASPNQKFPAFQSLADAIPSPKFSESERKFLLTVVGMSSPVTNTGCSKDPSCKRALLDSL